MSSTWAKSSLAAGLLIAAVGLWLYQSQPDPAHTAEPPRAAPTPAAETDQSRALFVDDAPRAGVRFVHESGAGRFPSVEFSGGGCALFDADGDGDLDLFFVQSGPSDPPEPVKNRPRCALYRNRGDGAFDDATPGSGLDVDLGYAQGVAVGDIDNDERPDLFVTGYGANHLLRNVGGGRFVDVTRAWGLDAPHVSRYATSAAFGDIDGDGRLDLYVCYYNDFRHGLAASKPFPDLGNPVPHRLWRNTGERFVDISASSGIGKKVGRGLAVAFTDHDGDGRADIFVANDRTPHFLWRNRGSGRFVDVAAEAGCARDGDGQEMAGMGIALADVDHTGRESAFVTNFSDLPNVLFVNRGGVYETQTIRPAGLPKPLGFGCAFLDVDADGWPDLVATNGHVYPRNANWREPKLLFRNVRGRFVEVLEPAALGRLATPQVGRGLATGDIDGDGRVDFVAVNQQGAAQIFFNRNRSPNRWVGLKLVGTRSNRDGYGAQVRVHVGGDVRYAEVRAASSYLSSSDPRVFVGLGSAMRVDRVEVRWPSGRRDVWRGLPADAFHTLVEGRSPEKTSEESPQSRARS